MPNAGDAMKRLLLLLLLPICLHAQGMPWWVAHADGDGHIGGWRDAGHLTLFAPFGQFGNNMFFVQGSIGRFKDSSIGTLGGGYRVQLSGDLGWGVNAFCDYAYGDNTNLNWVQGGIGGEVIGSFFEVRANAYVPRLDVQTGSQRRVNTVEPGIVQQPIHVRPVVNITQIVDQEQQQARWGFDVEGGVGAPVGVGSVWGYVGYFRFQAHGLRTFEGPRARAEYRLPLPLAWGDAELWLGGEYARDAVHGSEGSATIHLQVPLFRQRRFGRSPNMCVFKRLGDSVRRQNGIVLQRFKKRTIEQRQVGLWFIRINGPDNAPGTQTMPTSLTTVNTFAQPGDFIFALNLLPGFQPIPIGTQLGGTAWTMKNEQTLVSFGNSNVANLNLGNDVIFPVFDLDGAGRGGLIQNQAGVNGVILGNNNMIQGTSIQSGVASIAGTGIRNLTITDTLINTFTTQGILLTNASGTLNITGNTIDGAGGATSRGIQLSNSGALTTFISITGNNTITRAGADGIFLELAGSGGVLGAVIDGNTIEDTGAGAGGLAGIRLATNVNTTGGQLAFRVSNNRVTTSARQAIRGDFSGAAGATTVVNGAVTSNTISTTGATGAVQMTSAYTNSNDTTSLLINSNTFTTITDVSIFGNLTTTTGTMNLTVIDNIDNSATVATDTNVILAQSSGTACMTATGNKTARGAGPPNNIIATRVAGSFLVTNQAALSTNNNGMTVTTTGTTNTTQNCPTVTTP